MGREEQGVLGHERYVLIPRTLVFLFCGDQVLLLRGAPTKRIWPDRYNGLGGHLERGESLLEERGASYVRRRGWTPWLCACAG